MLQTETVPFWLPQARSVPPKLKVGRPSAAIKSMPSVTRCSGEEAGLFPPRRDKANPKLSLTLKASRRPPGPIAIGPRSRVSTNSPEGHFTRQYGSRLLAPVHGQQAGSRFELEIGGRPRQQLFSTRDFKDLHEPLSLLPAVITEHEKVARAVRPARLKMPPSKKSVCQSVGTKKGTDPWPVVPRSMVCRFGGGQSPFLCHAPAGPGRDRRSPRGRGLGTRGDPPDGRGTVGRAIPVGRFHPQEIQMRVARVESQRIDQPFRQPPRCRRCPFGDPTRGPRWPTETASFRPS